MTYDTNRSHSGTCSLWHSALESSNSSITAFLDLAKDLNLSSAAHAFRKAVKDFETLTTLRGELLAMTVVTHNAHQGDLTGNSGPGIVNILSNKLLNSFMPVLRRMTLCCSRAQKLFTDHDKDLAKKAGDILQRSLGLLLPVEGNKLVKTKRWLTPRGWYNFVTPLPGDRHVAYAFQQGDIVLFDKAALVETVEWPKNLKPYYFQRHGDRLLFASRDGKNLLTTDLQLTPINSEHFDMASGIVPVEFDRSKQNITVFANGSELCFYDNTQQLCNTLKCSEEIKIRKPLYYKDKLLLLTESGLGRYGELQQFDGHRMESLIPGLCRPNSLHIVDDRIFIADMHGLHIHSATDGFLRIAYIPHSHLLGELSRIFQFGVTSMHSVASELNLYFHIYTGYNSGLHTIEVCLDTYYFLEN